MKDYMLDPPEQLEFPCCPVCGDTEYTELYFDLDDHICGCSECVSKKDASEYWEEQDEIAKERHDDMLYEQWRDEQCGLR